MESTVNVLTTTHELYARASSNPENATRPPVYKAIGISLAIASGVFIGISFVLKKTGLLKANTKYNEEAGEGYGYLKNAYWWTGMTLMILGEICNFVAYAFVDAILVTPLGALSVVITTVLSAIFLKERLSFVGKIGCFICIIGSVVIVMNAPEQSSAATIQEMQHYVIAPGFLSYAGVVILGSAFIALWVAPRYGKKSMLVYLSICSLIGGLSVVATQGLGAAVVAQAGGTPQFNQWFLYVLLVFVVATLVTEIIYLNKALNLFNAALVTPTYYVFFTSATIVSSAILFRGFKGTPTSIATVVMGFLQICSGVILLQLSKSAKDVPDAKVFTGDLDQVRTVAEQEEPESEPKADAIRGTAAIIRRFSQVRQKSEAQEARRVHEDKMRDQMEPINEDEQIEWDGLRRRKTIISDRTNFAQNRKTMHPPLGMTHFPADYDEDEHGPRTGDSANFNGGFFDSIRRRSQRTQSAIVPNQRRNLGHGTPDSKLDHQATDVTQISLPAYKSDEAALMADTSYSNHPMTGDTDTMEMSHVFGIPSGLQKPLPDPHGLDGAGAGPFSPGGLNKPITWSPTIGAPQSAHQGGLSPNFAPTPPPHGGNSGSRGDGTKRQFSFQNVFHRNKTAHSDPSSVDEGPHGRQASTNTSSTGPSRPSSSRKGLRSRAGSAHKIAIPGLKSATEEERLGLVKGDSRNLLSIDDEDGDPDRGFFRDNPISGPSSGGFRSEDEEEVNEDERLWRGSTYKAPLSPGLIGGGVPMPIKEDREVEEEEKQRRRVKEIETDATLRAGSGGSGGHSAAIAGDDGGGGAVAEYETQRRKWNDGGVGGAMRSGGGGGGGGGTEAEQRGATASTQHPPPMTRKNVHGELNDLYHRQQGGGGSGGGGGGGARGGGGGAGWPSSKGRGGGGNDDDEAFI